MIICLNRDFAAAEDDVSATPYCLLMSSISLTVFDRKMDSSTLLACCCWCSEESKQCWTFKRPLILARSLKVARLSVELP